MGPDFTGAPSGAPPGQSGPNPYVLAGIGAGADVLGGLISFKGASDANRTNMMVAQRQMDFQERMSNTAYQRQVRDMIAAGLNPAMAYRMSGASTPGGAGATMQNELAGAGSAVSSAGKFASNVVALQQARLDMAQKLATIDLTKAQAETQRAEAAQRPMMLSSLLSLRDSQANVNASSQTVNEVRAKEIVQQLELVRQTFGERVAAAFLQNVLLRGQIRQNAAVSESVELGLPELRNLAKAQGSAWMRNVQPYMSSADQISRIISQLIGSVGGIGRLQKGVPELPEPVKNRIGFGHSY